MKQHYTRLKFIINHKIGLCNSTKFPNEYERQFYIASKFSITIQIIKSFSLKLICNYKKNFDCKLIKPVIIIQHRHYLGLN